MLWMPHSDAPLTTMHLFPPVVLTDDNSQPYPLLELFLQPNGSYKVLQPTPTSLEAVWSMTDWQGVQNISPLFPKVEYSFSQTYSCG